MKTVRFNPLDLLVFLSAIVIPLYFSMFRIPVGGAILRPADLLSFLVVFFSLFFLGFIRREFLYKHYTPIYVYYFFLFFHSLVASGFGVAFKETLQVIILMSFMIVNHRLIRENKQLYVKVFMTALWISVIYAVFYHISIGQFVRYKLAGDAKYAFGLLSVFSFLLYMSSKNKVWLYSFCFSIVPLVLSLERKGLLGVVVALFVSALLYFIENIKVSFRHLLAVLFIFLVISSFIWSPEISDFYAQLAYDDLFIDESTALYTSNIHRTSLLVNGVDIFMNNFWFGIGADQVTSVMGEYYHDPTLGNSTHNFYLDNLISGGLVGFMFLCFPLFHLIKFWSGLFSKENISFVFYSLFVVFFMAGGSQVFIIFFMPVFLWRLFEKTEIWIHR